MEKGFFHPSRGYWQTTNEPSAEILATYPEGTISVPLKPGADYDWQDGEWVYVEPKPMSEIIPEEITRIQFFHKLGKMGVITREEAKNSALSIPKSIQDILDTIKDEDKKFDLEMFVLGTDKFYRNSELSNLIKTKLKWSKKEHDNFWLEASKL